MAAPASTHSSAGGAKAMVGSSAVAGGAGLAPAAAGDAGRGSGGRSGSGASGQDAGRAGSQPSADGGRAGSQPSAANAGSADPPQPSAASAAAPSCAGQVCADFEDGTQLDALDWEVVSPDCTGTGQASVDATVAHAGKQSLKVDGAGGYCNHVFGRPRGSAFIPSDPLYVRFYVRLSTPLGANHATFLAMRDEHEAMDLRLGGQSQVLIWNRQSDDATLPELSPTGIAASAMPQTDRWYCLEFLIDGQASSLQTWLDGEPLAGLIADSDPSPDVDRQWLRDSDWHPHLSDVRFGWESYGNDANTLWIDDVVLGTSRSGCAP
jgi:hypothetical protein